MEGKCFFSASLDGTVAMIDTLSTTVLHQFKSVDAEVLCLAKVSSSTFSILLSYVTVERDHLSNLSSFDNLFKICQNKQAKIYVCIVNFDYRFSKD